MIDQLKPLTHKTVGLLLTGGVHHILHLVPIASGLEQEDNIDVEVKLGKVKTILSIGSTR